MSMFPHTDVHKKCVLFYDGGLSLLHALHAWLQLKGGEENCVKMALKELGAQLAGPISVRVATDDSQFS